MNLPFQYKDGVLYGPDNFALNCYALSDSASNKAKGDIFGQQTCDVFNAAYQENPELFMTIGQDVSQHILETQCDLKPYIGVMMQVLCGAPDRHQ